MTPRLELRDLRKDFNGRPVLSGIDLGVAAGEFCVFIGPSGCGKSTLLRLIAGLDEVSGGEIRIDGRVVTHLPPAERDLAMVFQGYALYPHMTALENMAFGLRYRKLPADEIERRVAEASRMLRLEPLLQRKPRELSGGQRQRVAIGRAIVRQPRLFLFDEPLSNLDAALRVNTRIELARLHRELGTASTVYVTHDQVEAMTLADTIVLLRPGAERGPSIAQVGPPLALYHRPANLFVAGFIGSPAMNFLSGEVSGLSEAAVTARVAGGACWTARVQPQGLAPGAPVTLGIRPEHVRMGTGPGRARVVHVEQLGELCQLYLRPEGGDDAAPPLLAKVAVAPAALGDALAFDLPAEALHCFTADSQALPRVLD
ncbi:ABC transporter ATP-binding protein [Aquabacterium sp.]|uniref:ABC transporter ATP-binding protein n=1 Tax=Aquabacterium sp. TaxID=1872578 RepID=UPI002CF1D912|nr:ATP-binding cassette domain-containing protein [Aquabacterium sp.]HSW07817.1 ATP-binding cassette domain-containing protein [Aquabacterium sp.]